MFMKCQRSLCYKKIPSSKKATAKYCSDECSYKERLGRSKKRYERIVKPIKEIEKNDKILEVLYQVQELGKDVVAQDLDKIGFNFGISIDEFKIDYQYHAKKMNKYAYSILKYEKIKIWKL